MLQKCSNVLSLTRLARPSLLLSIRPRESRRCLQTAAAFPARRLHDELRIPLTTAELVELEKRRRDLGIFGRLRADCSFLLGELKLWTAELKNRFNDPFFVAPVPHGTKTVVFDFRKPQVRQSWYAVCDSSKAEGFSQARVEQSATGVLRFHGCLDVDRLPNDGETERTGWACASSPRKMKSFARFDFYEWRAYTHLTLLLRGDGRTYTIVLRTPGAFDFEYHKQYVYGLYTRGGPYWQKVRIPFSKFVPGSHGRTYDQIRPLYGSEVNSIGITIADSQNGPFELEIAEIGVESDDNFDEEFAYETYYMPKHKWSD